MPKYYCDYCRSYLTHDSTSVRKSHLVGKNHIKFVADYYEREARLLGKWETLDEDDEIINLRDISLDQIYGASAPGIRVVPASDDENDYDYDEYGDTNNFKSNDRYSNRNSHNKMDAKAISKEDNYSQETSSTILNVYEASEEFLLPPPPSLSSMPNPPPSVLRYSEHYVDNGAKLSKSVKADNKSKQSVTLGAHITTKDGINISSGQNNKHVSSHRSDVNNQSHLKAQRTNKPLSTQIYGAQFNMINTNNSNLSQNIINKQGFNSSKVYAVHKGFNKNQSNSSQQGYKYQQTYSNSQTYNQQGYNNQNVYNQQSYGQQGYNNTHSNYQKYNKPKFSNQNYPRNRGYQNNRNNSYNPNGY